MFAFIRVFAIAMIAIGVLSFLGVGITFVSLESIPAGLEDYSLLEDKYNSDMRMGLIYGWSLSWGGSVLLSLQAILEALNPESTTKKSGISTN